MTACVFYAIGSICFLIGTLINVERLVMTLRKLFNWRPPETPSPLPTQSLHPFDSAMHTLRDAAVNGTGCTLNHEESDSIFRTLSTFMRHRD